MKYEVIIGDITKVPADAIVNAAHTSLLGGGGVDGAIHNAAGIELLNECRTLGGCPTGSAKTTKAYNLPAQYVIHAVGPCYNRSKPKESEQLLHSVYKACLDEAVEKRVKTISFPAISCGIYRFPTDDAVHIACQTIYNYRKVPNYVCDAFPMGVKFFFDKITFVVSSTQIADLYHKEIKKIQQEEKAWRGFLKLIEENEENFELRKAQFILEEYPQFINRDDSLALTMAVNNKTTKNTELLKLFIKAGADVNAKYFRQRWEVIDLIEFVEGDDEHAERIRQFLIRKNSSFWEHLIKKIKKDPKKKKCDKGKAII